MRGLTQASILFLVFLNLVFASDAKSETARVEPSVSLLSYDEIIALPPSKRLEYIRQVRMMMIEFEGFQQQGFEAYGVSKANWLNHEELLAELESRILNSLFIYKSSEALSTLISRAGAETAMSWVCPEDGNAPAQQGLGWRANTWVCRKGAPKQVDVLSLRKQQPTTNLSSTQQAQVKPAGPQTGNPTAPENQAAVKPAAPKPFDQADYEIGKLEAAGQGGFDKWAASAQRRCPDLKLMNAKECKEMQSSPEKTTSCLIAGVKSNYGRSGKAKFCQPVSTLCYDKQGKQLVNDECKSVTDAKRVFKCGAGKTVCSLNLGRETPVTRSKAMVQIRTAPFALPSVEKARSQRRPSVLSSSRNMRLLKARSQTIFLPKVTHLPQKDVGIR